MAQHFIDFLEAIAKQIPDDLALTFRAKGKSPIRLTFAELDARINRASNMLTALGIERGDHVGCHLHDTPAHVDVMLGAWKLGAVPINVNFRYMPDELVYLFKNADLKLVVTEPSLADSARQAAESSPMVKQVVVADAQYESRIAECSPDAPVSTRTGDDVYMLYTGGTTGMPKGVMWRHSDLLYGCFGIGASAGLGLPDLESPENAARILEQTAEADRGQRRTCPLFPLMHGGGQWAMCRALCRGGSTVIISDVSFDAAFALQVIAEEKISTVWAAGDAHARPILDVIDAQHDAVLELPALNLWITSAVMLTPANKTALEKALPETFIFDALGASETGGQGTAVGYTDEGSPRFLMGEGALILDDDMRPIPPGDPRTGKLAKTGHIPLGYYKDDEKTAATFPVIDGVRYSVPGDMARWDADEGVLILFGRGSASINTGGEKVYPEEVEKALKTHPAVLDAIVVGTPDERFGKRVTAVVQLRDGAADPGLSALADHCRTKIAGYKVPRSLVLQDEIVRSPSGKPDYPWAIRVAKEELAKRELS